MNQAELKSGIPAQYMPIIQTARQRWRQGLGNTAKPAIEARYKHERRASRMTHGASGSFRLQDSGVDGAERLGLLLGGSLDRVLHLLEGADLDLPDALAADVEFGRELLQRQRVVGETASLE